MQTKVFSYDFDYNTISRADMIFHIFVEVNV